MTQTIFFLPSLHNLSVIGISVWILSLILALKIPTSYFQNGDSPDFPRDLRPPQVVWPLSLYWTGLDWISGTQGQDETGSTLDRSSSHPVMDKKEEKTQFRIMRNESSESECSRHDQLWIPTSQGRSRYRQLQTTDRMIRCNGMIIDLQCFSFDYKGRWITTIQQTLPTSNFNSSPSRPMPAIHSPTLSRDHFRIWEMIYTGPYHLQYIGRGTLNFWK